MASRSWPTVGTAVWRSAPWPVVAGAATAAGVLFGGAIATRHHGIALMFVILAVGTCGALAAYLLDEEAAEVADATPTSRSRRTAWRVCLALLPAGLAVAALLLLHHLDRTTPWLRLLPVAVGSVALGLAVAAALRRSGQPSPGDLAAASTLLGVVLIVPVDPLRRWFSLSGMYESDYPVSSGIAWGVILTACAGALIACGADPGRASLRAAPRKERT